MKVLLFLMVFTFLGIEAEDTVLIVPRCASPLEVWSQCNARCQATCQDPSASNPCVKICAPGCVCREGLVRSINGECIPPEKCTLPCGANEHYEQCARTCPSEDCSAIGQVVFCPRQPPPNCRPACRCNDGYRRNSYGICIPVNDCRHCGVNEIYSCGSACQTTCDTLGQTCPIVNIRCNDACFCIDGYARNAHGKCIPIKTCPQPINE